MSNDVPGPDPADELEPGTIVGGYRIERKLAEGGMGTVYIAAHTILPRRAALKILRSELMDTPLAVESLVREGCMLETMIDSRVARIYDAGYLQASRPWIAMELLEGECLADIFVRKQRMSVSEVAQLVSAIVDALGAAHSRGVVHSDIKPENMMVSYKASVPTVKMIDWGIAQLAASTVDQGAEAFAIGTPHYMSPEQVRGEHYDQRADIYALGVLTYELLTGKTPFNGDTPTDIALHHLRTTALPIKTMRDDVPPAIDSLVAAMLAKEPGNRPALETVRACMSLVSDSDFLASEVAKDSDDVEMSVEVEIDYTKDEDLVREALSRPRWTPGVEPLGARETLRLGRIVSSGGKAAVVVAGEIRTPRSTGAVRRAG
ncbi:MAG: serine/threonine-protein kinase [Polyangia bacterium]